MLIRRKIFETRCLISDHTFCPPFWFPGNTICCIFQLTRRRISTSLTLFWSSPVILGNSRDIFVWLMIKYVEEVLKSLSWTRFCRGRRRKNSRFLPIPYISVCNVLDMNLVSCFRQLVDNLANFRWNSWRVLTEIVSWNHRNWIWKNELLSIPIISCSIFTWKNLIGRKREMQTENEIIIFLWKVHPKIWWTIHLFAAWIPEITQYSW